MLKLPYDGKIENLPLYSVECLDKFIVMAGGKGQPNTNKIRVFNLDMPIKKEIYEYDTGNLVIKYLHVNARVHF